MKRVLVVDDERPVVEAVELMVRRDLSEEFMVVGNASSGRDAVEKALALAPDIVLMDVWMPGISGLDAVREIRSRGLFCVFILVTAYERFDIAREAMELGVLDYLLKPVSRDKLAGALRAAAAFADRRFEIERREMEHREREERLRSFVEEAFLRAVMMDDGDRFDVRRYEAALDISDTWAVVAAAFFLPPPGAPDPEAEVRALYDGFRSTVRYKTRALTGPFLTGFTAVLIPVTSPESEAKEVLAFRSVVEQAHGAELSRGALRIGYAAAVPLSEANRAWPRAFRETRASSDPVPASASPGPDGEAAAASGWDDARDFVPSLAGGETDRARIALEGILRSVRGEGIVPMPDRYRIVALFAEAYREFERRGFMSPDEIAGCMNLDDVRMAESAAELALISRERFSVLASAASRIPRWSGTVARAVTFIRENYGRQISLEATAEEVLISPNRLSRLFVEETGRGFSDFLIEVRMEQAKRLLSEPGASIKRVSAECGYPDPNYFSRVFKKVTGFTPTAFSSDSGEGPDAES